MKKIYSITFFILSFIVSDAQNVTGTIKDSISESYLEGVMVSFENTSDHTQTHTHTDISGHFSVINLTEGRYEIDFTKLGFELLKKVVDVKKMQNTIINEKMIVKSISLPSVQIATDRSVSAASSGYISAIDFENRPKNSAQDMLRLVPGLFIAQHAGGGKAEQIFIRGFDCDHGTDVATYVDGVPVNMPSHGHGQGYEDLHFLIPEIVREMEIFKGPYSPKYGDFATGAAINFSTLDSLDTNILKLEQTYTPMTSALNAPRVLAMVNAPFSNEKVNSYLAADIINNKGYFEAPQNFKRINLFSKVSFALNENSKLKITLSTFNSSWNASGQIPDRAVQSGLITRFGSIDDSEGGNTGRTNFNLSYSQKTSTGEFETQAYTFNYRFRLFSNFTFFAEDPVNGDEIEQDDNRNVQGLNARYTINHKIGKMNNKFTIGMSYRSDDIENGLWHVRDRERLDVRANAHVLENNSAVYINEVFRFNDHFRIEAGVRYDYFNFDVEDLLPTDSFHTNYSGINFQSALNPKLNLIYTQSDKVQIFLNSGRGFHSNDARSLVKDKMNHELPMADGAEIGTVLSLSRRFVLSAAFWWMDLSNELVYVGDDGTTEEKGSSRRSGIDFSVRYQLTGYIFADADLNISKGRFTTKLYGEELRTDNLIPLAPTFTSSGGLTYNNNKTELGIRYRYLGDRPANEDNSIIAKGYTIIDATASYKIKKIKLSLAIENVLNAEWNEAQFATESRLFDEAINVEELHYTPGTPVAFKVGLQYSW